MFSIKISTESKSDVFLQLLICGYIRENHNALKLFLNVPNGIVQIIHNLYPVLLFTFGDFNKERFILSDDNTILKGNSDSCNGYMVYADLGENNDIGLKAGIHFWTVKSLFCNEKDDWNEFADCPSDFHGSCVLSFGNLYARITIDR